MFEILGDHHNVVDAPTNLACYSTHVSQNYYAMTREERLRRTVERGKYALLHRHLRARGGQEWRVSFTDLEELLGFTLPESARVHRPWWSNQRNGGHGHALAWQVAGWKTRAVDLEQETLVFERDVPVDDPVQSPGPEARGRSGAVDLDAAFPPYDPGPWPVGLSLRREDLYDDRGR